MKTADPHAGASSEFVDRLDSWKAIAAHLGRTVRTIQRWERTAGLPIRRLQHADGASVYALRSELEEWWNRRSRQTSRLDDVGVTDSAFSISDEVSTAATAARVAPTVGRTAEQRDLRRAFDKAASGRGALLAIAGEAGIGKSTLVDAFLATLDADSEAFIGRGRSAESLAGTEAFLPLLDALDDLLRMDTSGALKRAIKIRAPLWFSQLRAGANNGAPRDLSLDVSGMTQPQRIKRELLAFFQEACRVRPVVLFLDDLHWADSSSLDVLAYITRQIESLRLLVIVTYRRDELLLRKHPFLPIQHDLEARGLCRTIELGLLTRAELGQYIQQQFPGLPETFANGIFKRTEGNPLFMASLLGYLSDKGAFANDAGRWVLTAGVGELLREVPASVRGMIGCKIHAIPKTARRLLAVASVQGIEFYAAVVARVLDLRDAEVEECLQRLEQVYGCVESIGEQELPAGTFTVRYRFVHVLYQEHLRESFTPARLGELSRVTAEALVATHTAQTAEIAARLGTLYETARDFAAATNYYLEAAARAVSVFAYEDAIELGYRGVSAAARVPLEERRGRELALLLLVAASIKAVRGFASNQLPELYMRARDLSVELGRTTELADVLWGLWGSQIIRLDLLGALDSVRQMQQLCARASGTMICVQALVGESLVAYYRGDFAHAKRTWQEALSMYDADRHGPLPVAAGWDPLVSVHGHAALAALSLGEEDQAVDVLETSMARAREIGHVPTLIYALFFATLVHEWRRDDMRAEALIAEMFRLSGEYQLVHFVIIAQFLQGRVRARHGDHDAGIQQMRTALASYEALGAHTCRSRFVAMLSEELGRAGQCDAAIAVVERELNALGSARYYEAELLRVRGELLRLRDRPGDQLEANRILSRALAVARTQRAAAFERRILECFDPGHVSEEAGETLSHVMRTDT